MGYVKKGLSLVLTLALLLSAPVWGEASSADAGVLTLAELNEWAAVMLAKAKNYKPLVSGAQAQKTEDGYEVVYDFATFYLDTPELTDDSVLNAITVTEHDVECPRGVGVYDTAQTLLSAYANENPTLLGSRDFAVLYLTNSLPEVALWGWVQRDGQQVMAVQYAVHELISNEGDYSDCGIVYSLEEGFVTTVRAYGLAASVSREQVDQVIAEVADAQLEDAYFAYPQSSVGTDLPPFEREDLFFSGMDYLSLTPETAVEALGAYEEETWLQDDTGDWLRILQWPMAEITFAYSEGKVFKRVDTLAISQRGLEGPRAVMVGDSLSSVMMRFRHGEGEFDGVSTEVLYGNGGTAPYGMAEYENVTATLHYTCPVESGQGIETVTLFMIFVDTMLSELFLYSW